MKNFIQITRHLYEEPYQLNLVIIASNGYTQGTLEVYFNSGQLQEIGNGLATFPRHGNDRYKFSAGSEYAEDNFGWFIRFAARSLGNQEDCMLNFRFNNNQKIHKTVSPFETPQLVDFSIRTKAEQVNALGLALLEFSSLKHQRLYWSDTDTFLDNNLINKNDYTSDVIESAFLSLPK